MAPLDGPSREWIPKFHRESLELLKRAEKRSSGQVIPTTVDSLEVNSDVTFVEDVKGYSLTIWDRLAQAKRIERQNKENLLKSRALSTTAPKKASFVDPQPNAQRVEWNEDFELLSNLSTDQEHHPVNDGPKRKRPVQPDDDIDDEEYDEFGQADIPRKAAKRSKLAVKQRQFVDEASAEARRCRAMSADRLAAKNEFELEVDEEEEKRLPRASRYHIVKQVGKRRTQLENRKGRVKWTAEEENALIRYIGEHGCSWAIIKKADERGLNSLRHRDQGALKDKARNMKVDYLKAGCGMPKNFDGVAIGVTIVRKLRNKGIEV